MSGSHKIRVFSAVLLTAVSLLTGLNASAATQKIATVNLEKVFRNYYRTRIIDQNFTEQGKVYRNYIARQAEMLKKDEELYKQKLDSSLNVALTVSERQKRAAEAENLKRSLQLRRAELERYAAEKSKLMQETAASERKKVLDEIQAEIRRRAAIEGYTLVLDTSGRTMNDTPLILYSIDTADITDKVLAELNRGAAAPARK